MRSGVPAPPKGLSLAGNGRCFLSNVSLVWGSTLSTNPPSPRICPSPFWYSPAFRCGFTAAHPPTLRVNPPPVRASRLPAAIPFCTDSRYRRRARGSGFPTAPRKSPGRHAPCLQEIFTIKEKKISYEIGEICSWMALNTTVWKCFKELSDPI